MQDLAQEGSDVKFLLQDIDDAHKCVEERTPRGYGTVSAAPLDSLDLEAAHPEREVVRNESIELRYNTLHFRDAPTLTGSKGAWSGWNASGGKRSLAFALVGFTATAGLIFMAAPLFPFAGSSRYLADVQSEGMSSSSAYVSNVSKEEPNLVFHDAFRQESPAMIGVSGVLDPDTGHSANTISQLNSYQDATKEEAEEAVVRDTVRVAEGTGRAGLKDTASHPRQRLD